MDYCAEKHNLTKLTLVEKESLNRPFNIKELEKLVRVPHKTNRAQMVLLEESIKI